MGLVRYINERHSSESWNPGYTIIWILAFAGMTMTIKKNGNLLMWLKKNKKAILL